MMAAMLFPKRRVLAVCGDGGFMMNSQEMETAVRLKLNLVVMVLIFPVLGAMASTKEADGIQRLVWWIFAAVLVLLLPLRGLSALTQERRANTLDTLLLTNLKAGRIVWGKWLAAASQVLLVGCSVLPYILMLYVGGGISLDDSILTLLRLMLAGLVLAASYVALSWNDSWLHRAAPGLALAALAMNEYAWPLVAGLIKGGLDPAWNGAARMTAELAGGGALIAILLEGTAQRLAPATEHHQALPRLVALGLILLAMAVPHPFAGVVALVVLTLVSITALTEPWPVHPRDERAWHRWPGLDAGWPHGVLWAVAAWGITLTGFHAFQSTLAGPAIRLAAWIFCGRMLLCFGPSAWGQRAGLLLATALFFILIQAALVLAGQLLNLTPLSAAAGLLPAPFLMFDNGATPGPHAWTAAGGALACLLFAGTALRRDRSSRKAGDA